MFNHYDRMGQGASVQVDCKVTVRSDYGADGSTAIMHDIRQTRWRLGDHWRQWIKLDDGKARIDRSLSTRCKSIGIRGQTNVGVGPQRSAQRTPQQLMHWHAGRLARDVPKCDVNAGKGRGFDRTAPPVPVTINGFPQTADVCGITPDDQPRRVLHRTRNRIGFARQRTFAPTYQSRLVSPDLDKDQVGKSTGMQMRFDFSYFHGFSTSWQWIRQDPKRFQ